MSLLMQNWTKTEITDPEVLKEMFMADEPIDFAIDTETDGLFHMTSKPFLIVFGWTPKNHAEDNSQVVIFEPTIELLQTMYDLCGTVNLGYMHNAKFDMHMLENFGLKYPHKNIVDTMTIARLVLEARSQASGGDSLALKKLADKYIETNSSDEQKVIKSYRRQIQSKISEELNIKLLTLAGNENYNKVKLEAINSDPVLDLKDVVSDVVYDIFKEWSAKYPAAKGLTKTDRVTYKMIYEFSKEAKQAMKDYAYNDVVYTIAIARKFMPYVMSLELADELKAEQSTMYALYDSERVGITIDMDYIKSAKQKMQAYITKLRNELQGVLNKPLLKAEQVRLEAGFAPTENLFLWDGSMFPHSNPQIKKWLAEQGNPVQSTSADALDALNEDDALPENVKIVISHIVKIRKLVKKYSTDLLGFERMEWNGRRYTVFNQNGTVTGRLSNDMQQMPNAGILDEEGNELFHPRKAVIVDTKSDYDQIAYLDYSQVEVRVQAHYTWLAMNGKGDTNLLRMYVPFNCHAVVSSQRASEMRTGKPLIGAATFCAQENVNWDPTNPLHINEEFIEKYNWIQNEDNKPWEITDMHMLTARQAFPELEGLSNDDPLVKKRRKQAKSINFAIQYGAGEAKVKLMAETPEVGAKLYAANKSAFAGLVEYSKMLRKFFNEHGYVENAYGRKYKLKWFSHKMANYVVQGTGASLLKRKISETTEYLKNKKTRVFHNIHDEIQFEVHKDEHWVIPELKKIMEQTDNMFVVPIVADVEITTTNWKEKYEIN